MFRNIDRTFDRPRRRQASPREDARSGFTVAEVLVASSVAATVSIGVFAFFLTSFKIGFVSRERNQINADIRGLTSRLVDDGRQSNYFLIYNSTNASDRDEASDRQVDGSSGDFLLFVYTEEGSTPMESSKISRLVGYYRATETNAEDELAPVRRFEETYSPASSEPVETLLEDGGFLNGATDVIELSRGLANGDLFYNFWGRSVMVNGQIYHGNEAKRVTETYNFTLSPRG